jgi:PAS domain S-box-containing protein
VKPLAPTLTAALAGARLQQHERGVHAAVGASAAAGLLLVVGLGETHHQLEAWSWLTALAMALGLRLLIAATLRRRRNLGQPVAAPAWILGFRLAFLAHGLVWGAALPTLADGPESVFYIWLAVVLMVAGSYIVSPFDLVAPSLFGAPAVIGLALTAAAGQADIGLNLALVGMLFLATVLLASLRTHRMMTEHALLQHNEGLRLAELQRSEARLQEAQHLAQVGSFDWDPVSGALDWSDEHFRLWGLAPGSCTPDYALFRSAIHPGDLEDIELQLATALAGQSRYDCVHRLRAHDGIERVIHGRAEVSFDDQGRALRMLGTVHDVTERRQAAEALERSLDNLTLTLNATGDAIFASDATDAGQSLLFVNERMLQMWGIPPEEARELTPATVMRHAGAQFRDPPREIRRIQEIITSSEPAEDRVELKDGRVLLRRCHPMHRAGRWVRVWGFRDITVEAQALRQLELARDEAERANLAKSEFLNQMSHELRTPLNAILGFSQLLQYDPDLPETLQEDVQEILKAGHHLLGLINEILDLARIESGRVKVQLESVDLQEVLADCLGLIAPQAQARGLRVESAGLPELQLCADPKRLKQVLLNLLSNAVKYNREQGRIRLTAHQHPVGRLRLSISDDGPGIPADRLDELFQPFNRLGAESSEVEGTGIGLTITRQLTELMHGSVGVISPEGEGATFWIELPLAQRPHPQEEPRAAEPQQAHLELLPEMR